VTIREITPGDTTKASPYTIAIVCNPVLETPIGSGAFAVDPLASAPADFASATGYIVDCLFGRLPGQVEALLADPSVAPFVRILSVSVSTLPPDDSTALIAHDNVSNMLIPRRAQFASFLSTHGVEADVAYAVSGSATHTRASAWFTSDDDARLGVPFTLDGVSLSHRFWPLVPGTVAIHKTAASLTALHEFQHAASSYTNGQIVDLYIDSAPGLNCKRGRPIPGPFGTYGGSVYSADGVRDGLGYPGTWASYHCALHDAGRPAVMDNYFAGVAPEQCQNDTITRQFLLDRLRAKIAR